MFLVRVVRLIRGNCLKAVLMSFIESYTMEL